MRKVVSAMAIGLALSACAGRDPAPIATVQVQDAYSDCTMIRAEIEGNNQKAKQLADESGMKTAQNVAAGVVGVSFGRYGLRWIQRVRQGPMQQPYSRASNTSPRWRRNGANPDIGSRHPRVTVRLHKATPHRRLGNDPKKKAL